MSYAIDVKHDGQSHHLEFPALTIPKCKACGELAFSNSVDDQILQALRTHLRLLAPEQIRSMRESLGLKSKELAEKLGVAAETICRWERGGVIQSRAMDNLLRIYFAVPKVREVLRGADQDPSLGSTVQELENGGRRAMLPKDENGWFAATVNELRLEFGIDPQDGGFAYNELKSALKRSAKTKGRRGGRNGGVIYSFPEKVLEEFRAIVEELNGAAGELKPDLAVEKRVTLTGQRSWRYDRVNLKHLKSFPIPKRIVQACGIRDDTKRHMKIRLSTEREIEGVCTISSGCAMLIPKALEGEFENAESFECKIGDEMETSPSLHLVPPGV